MLAIAMHRNLMPPNVASVVSDFKYEACSNQPSKSRDISAIGKHLSVVRPTLYCTCAEAAIFELPVRHFEFDRKWIITVARRSRPIVHQRISLPSGNARLRYLWSNKLFCKLYSFMQSYLQMTTVLFDIIQPLCIRSTSRSVGKCVYRRN